MSMFGQLLRAYRERCIDPQSRTKLTQSRLAELCDDESGTISRTNTTISNWERGESVIDHRDRVVLLNLIKVLHQCGGIRTIEEANRLLEAGDYRQLNREELANLFPSSLLEREASQIAVETVPSSSVASVQPARPFMTPSLPPQGILGREADLQQIFALLQARDTTTELPRLALRGMGGVGKTTLAIAVGRSPLIPRTFPDGVLWASLGLRPTLRTIFEQWGQALGINLQPERDEAACQSCLRAALFQRRVLLIVDDVWDIKDGQALMVGGPQCQILFTTREMPIAHTLATSARTLRVDILSVDASLDLLQRLAPQAVAAEPKSAQQLCERLEFLPLALNLAGQLLANEAEVPARVQRLTQMLIERRDARLNLLHTQGRLGGSETEPVSVAAILGLSVERLNQTDQDRFALLGTFGGEPLSWEINAAAYVWECSVQEAEATLSRLIQRGLVERRGERYWMHALLADYAEEMRENRGL